MRPAKNSDWPKCKHKGFRTTARNVSEQHIRAALNSGGYQPASRVILRQEKRRRELGT